ncbi:hypothetical protein KYC5002_17565 [Archangium violaceum]|uniref:hypothetical protein n=1 Tax=Archangium violaceum TaxID=83451 RepID=UPI002B29AED6|nr:hypothetical protein KYC5002_17565 [Archangium gephyra]
MHPNLFTTTITMPLELRAELDKVKAQHARRTGKRPPINTLILEALQQYVVLQRERTEQ